LLVSQHAAHNSSIMSEEYPGRGEDAIQDRAARTPSASRWAVPTDAPTTNVRPLYLRDHAFYGMTVTQFLGAFNDNLFKQLMLLVLIAVPAAGAQTRDLQPYAMGVFSLPFILFSGFAGYLSDRCSKRRVIVLSKVAEIVIMGLGVAAFAIAARGGQWGLVALLAVLFLMGTQSAFFGPSKYGILPEILRRSDLSRANGIVIMTTFLAIIFGTALAGWLKDIFGERLWVAALFCILVAVTGTLTSLLVRPVRASQPGLAFRPATLMIAGETRRLLLRDRTLLLALVASSLFWFVGALVQPAVNAFGKIQLSQNNTQTSILVATIGVGVALGCLGSGMASAGRIRFSHLRIGAWGILTCLLVLSLSRAGGVQWLGYQGCLLVLLILGVFTGMYSVPLQVFLQARPPEGLKGRMIATQNLINWIAIFLSAPVYKLVDVLLRAYNLPVSGMFAVAAVAILPVAIFYQPQDESLA